MDPYKRKDFYKHASTTVFWNVEDFPIPPGRDLNFFYQTFKSALEKEGYHGCLLFKAYGAEDCFDRSIPFVTERDPFWRLHRMLIDIDMWTLSNSSIEKPTNLMVLAKNISNGIDFVHLLDMLSGYNVLLAVPQEWKPEEMPLPKVNKAWYWESLIGGEKPMDVSPELFSQCQVSMPNYFLY